MIYSKVSPRYAIATQYERIYHYPNSISFLKPLNIRQARYQYKALSHTSTNRRRLSYQERHYK
jgi:hypothetical protein